MRRLLLTGRLDGRAEVLADLRAAVQERRPHGVLFAGGVLGNAPASGAEKLKRWDEFFAGFGDLGVFAAVVPGAGDVPQREFLRMARGAEVAHPNLRVAHATVFEEHDVAVCGLGGELTESADAVEGRLSYARGSAEYFLRTLWQSEQTHKVLLLNVPPPGQLGGEEGNRVCGDFIDSYHPSLCLVAGTTERRGVQRIAHTTVVNPGRLADGYAAWLDWNRGRDEQVELLRL